MVCEDSDTGLRLDKCLSQRLPDLSRSRIQQLLAQGCVTAGGGTITDAARKVKPGETYFVRIPALKALEVAAVSMPLSIVFEDNDLIVIDKPAGLTVHPGPGHSDDTLVNALLAHCGASLSGVGGAIRPGIVHRIDKDTSGLLVVAKHDRAHQHLSAQLAQRTLKRQYLAVVKGTVKPPAGKVDAPIGRSASNRKKMAVVSGGRTAVTHYATEKTFKTASLVRCNLKRDVPTRYVCIWRISAIRLSVTRSMGVR